MPQEVGLDAAQEQTASKKPKWLVMIYLAGDNNLSPNSIAILQELEAASPPYAEVRVLACFDSNTPRPRGARYVEINRTAFTGQPTPTRCWDLHNDLVPFDNIPGHPVTTPNFCDPDPPTPTPISEPVAKEGLSRFLEFALKNHPAEKHMLILFGHGSAVAGNTFLVDDNPPSFLRLRDFADVLAKHFDDRPDTLKPKLEILACDNCMMNGIETAYQLRRQVNYILGSQGLMLTVGWPFRKLIRAIVNNKDDSPRRIARRMLRVCSRNLVDFSLMDRSSEQAICDLTTLRRDRNVVTAIRRLVAAMSEGLEFDKCGRLVYPAVRDAIRQARLEAQSYWGETFVDLYDFCELLLRQCNSVLSQHVNLLYNLVNRDKAAFLNGLLALPATPEGRDSAPAGTVAITQAVIKEFILRTDPGLKIFEQIALRCRDVLDEIRVKRFVRRSYYVGPELQYSHGLSIYFPWTLPQNPIMFEPTNGTPGGGGYGLVSDDFIFKTAFDEYKEYDFAKCNAGDWTSFLERFFRATLRNVRRFDFEYVKSTGDKSSVFFDDKPIIDEVPPFIPPGTIDLQKSSSSTGDEDDCLCPTVKNYPRRFYLSPEDCLRRCTLPGEMEPDTKPDPDCDPDKVDEEHCVSYLGWNVTGLVASVIGMKPPTSITPSGDDDDEIDNQKDCEPN